MKGKKLLAGILSAAMVLGTMVMPVFADNGIVTISGDVTPEAAATAFSAAMDNSDTTKIILGQDVTINADRGKGTTTLTVLNTNMVIDLNGKTLDRGNLDRINVNSGKNLTVTSSNGRGKITFTNIGDSFFKCYGSGTINIDNIDFSGHSNCYVISGEGENGINDETINVNNCNFNNITFGPDGWGHTVFAANGNTTFYLNNTNITSDNRAFQNGTYYVTGNSEIIGEVAGTPTVYAAGNNVTFSNYKNAIEIPATVTTTNGNVSCYDSLSDALAVANEGDTIDLYADATLGTTSFKNDINLNGNTLTMTDTESNIHKDITFSNGYIVANNLSSTAQGIFRLMNNLTFDGIEFTCNNLTGGCAFIIDAQSSTFEAKDSTFNIDGGAYTAAFGGGGDNTSVFDNCTITVKNISTGILHNTTLKNTTYNAENLEAALKTGENKTIILDNATVNVKDCDYSINMKYDGSKLEATNGTEIKVSGTKQAEVYIKGDNTVSFDETSSFEGTTNAAAKAGGVYYDTLDKALKSAKDGETVTLFADGSLADTDDVMNEHALTIDLNNKTLTIPSHNHNVKDDLTIKNGNIKVTGSAAGNAIFWLTSDDLTFELNNVKVDGTDFEQTFLVEAWDSNNQKVNIVDTIIDVRHTGNRATIAAVIGNNGTGTTITLDNSKMYVSNTTEHAILGTSGDVVIKNNSEVIADNTGSGIYITTGNLEIKDISTVEITNVVSTDDNSYNTKLAGIMLGEDASYTKDSTATVNAVLDQKTDPATSVQPDPNQVAVTDKITVELRKVADDEYDVIAKAEDNKTIYKLTTADLTFAMSNPKLGWEIKGAENVNVVRNDNGYVRFNYKKNDDATANSGSEVKLGTITIDGFGKGELKVTEGSINATAKTQNVTVTYDGDALVIANSKADVEIKVPTQTLTINVELLNNVKAQSAAYQDMTVTISGGELTENKVFTLGNDSSATGKIALDEFAADVKMTDGTYTMTAELEKYLTYNVEVSGGGYRTARYSVNMGGDKTLNFWNNVNTDENGVNTNRVIEVGTDPKTEGRLTSFLAGDIVKDNEINIYDLSAVVSYFGVKIGGTDTKSVFSQYDLDRDGKIDSKDVSMVLNSWEY